MSEIEKIDLENLYDEEIALRYKKHKDDTYLKESIENLAASVNGKQLHTNDETTMMLDSALSVVFHSLNIKYKNIDTPEEITNSNDYIDYKIRPYGIMKRQVKLDQGWYKKSTGPLILKVKNSNDFVAAIPNMTLTGYSYFDYKTSKKIRINKKNATLFEAEAWMFYQPLPQKKLSILDFVRFLLDILTYREAALFLGMLGVSTLLGLVTPFFSYMLFGPIVASRDLQALFAIAVFMITFCGTRVLLQCFQSILNSKIGTKIELVVESAVMSRVLTLPSTFFKDFSSGDLNQRISYVHSLFNTIFNSIISTSFTTLFSLVYIAQIFAYAPSLVLPALAITFITIALDIFYTFYQMYITKKRMEIETKESGMSYALIKGIQKIKTTGSEKRMFARWANLYSQAAQLTYNPPKILKFRTSIMLAVSLFGTLWLYVAAISGGVNVAEYYAFTTSYGMVTGAFTSLSSIVTAIADIKPTLEMSKPILDTIPENNEKKINITKLNGGVNIKHVTFRYKEDAPIVLEDFNLDVEPGEYLGIVGKTGCGKSTLLKLLLGFEYPNKGAIYYDNQSTENINLQSLCQNIGVVLQDGKLFTGDIYSNIAISNPLLTLDEAWKVAEIAQIADDIREMPMGMHTLISEGQGGISGGQRQRLMIARALASNPKIVMLDESTSALDNVTQKNVSDAIGKLNCTRIVIAHRLSTVEHCDRIVVIDEGHIVEEGNYKELLKKDGVFADLVRRQRLDIED
ncbi:MAG: ATP-binding cassette domain-containing protein [Coriobacteriia bacterium]|nr:ATP-binding cassette domain-containing protein [Coriobacteriia bacterium]